MDWNLIIAGAIPTAAFVIGAWKFLYNHIEHLRQDIRDDLKSIQQEFKDFRQYIEERLLLMEQRRRD